MDNIINFNNSQRELALAYLIWEATSTDEQIILLVAPMYAISRAMLRSLKSTVWNSELRLDVDRAEFTCNKTKIISKPIGSPNNCCDKLRGLKGTKLVLLDYEAIPEDILVKLTTEL